MIVCLLDPLDPDLLDLDRFAAALQLDAQRRGGSAPARVFAGAGGVAGLGLRPAVEPALALGFGHAAGPQVRPHHVLERDLRAAERETGHPGRRSERRASLGQRFDPP
ncbi:MAG TPA: hypothetical protein VMT85_07710, partial [Thermoanaerobaculia bacterium]|nr:hypothetical protein [Thermoanaerobaculia bacterium]